MKYEKPELTALTTAITAIQSATGSKALPPSHDNPIEEMEGVVGYADWER
jgi:hypothetical protein